MEGGIDPLCFVTLANQIKLAVPVLVIAAVCGVAARGLLRSLWRERQVEHPSLSGFGFGCFAPICVTLGLCMLVARIVPGVEDCYSTDVISYGFNTLLLSPLAFVLAYASAGKFFVRP